MRLKGKVAIVTGGSQGIGEAIAIRYATEGVRVAVVYHHNDGAALDVVKRINAAGGEARPIKADCSKVPEIERMVAEVIGQFGTVDILVNNAGNDTRHSIAEVTSTYWDQSMAINLKAQFFMAQALLPAMRKAARGSIINMSSIAWAIPSTNVPVYATAKAGIVGMTRTLAHELGADNIRVNCVMPGAVLTDRQKRLWLTESYRAEVLSNQALKRMVLPEEVARLVLFLAADDSAAITNQSFVIDAGWI